jgi:hypothetical protein
MQENIVFSRSRSRKSATASGNLGDSGGFRRLTPYRSLRRSADGRASKEYTAWANIVRRCEDNDSPNFKYYGGRGISVCRDWRASFDRFIRDVGPAPSREHWIGRIDNDGNYEPGNVRWETSGQQAQNRRPRHCSTCGAQGHSKRRCTDAAERRAS